MEWSAFEQVYGPILPHERIDFGLAHVAYRIIEVNSRHPPKFEKFLPRWLRNLGRPEPMDASALEAKLKAWAGAND
jgi:hypothetical protein